MPSVYREQAHSPPLGMTDRAAPLRRIAVRKGDRFHVIAADDIDAITASGNNVKLLSGNSVHVVRESLARLEMALDARSFVRVHRSAIVNVERVIEITTNDHGDCQLRMLGGCTIAMSRGYRQALRGRFGPEF